jgi:4'-phosphopantetheinyl transferase
VAKNEFLLDTRHVHVWTFELSAPSNVVESLRNYLDEDEISRAERFRFRHLQVGYVVAHGVLRRLLADYLGVNPAELHFGYNEQAKPRMADPDCNLRFNLSHSGTLGACAFALNCEIGVDIEQIRTMPDLFDIARRFFSPDECKDLETVAADKREVAFFDCWTRKEAYIKAIGGGLSVPLDSFRVSLLEGEPAQLLRVRPGDPGPWTIQEFDAGPGYRGAVAYNEDPRHLVIHRTTAEECLRMSDT